MIQIDGSEHRWFEDRAPPCTLLVFIDDATSTLIELRFVTSESTFAYFEALKAYLLQHGKTVAFYSDKHSIFRVSHEDAAGGDGMTQFGRACQSSISRFFAPIAARPKAAWSEHIRRSRIGW